MNIEISTEHLNSDIGKFQSELDNLTNAMDQVYRCLETLNGMWDGVANALFIAQTRKDHAVTNELIKNLNNLVECMEYARNEYNKCNEDVNSKIASIRLSNDT